MRVKRLVQVATGTILYLILMFLSNAVSYLRGPSLDTNVAPMMTNNDNLSRPASIKSIVLWTYSLPPPIDDKFNIDETLICSYHPCIPNNHDPTFDDRYLTPSKINLREITKDDPKFAEYVRNHAWYKIDHGLVFPHHIQVIALLSLVKSTKACVRTLGKDVGTSICYQNLKRYDGYDPREGNEIPSDLQMMIPELDFQQQIYGIMDFQTRSEQEDIIANTEDEMQSIAGAQFMPYVNDLVDREVGMPSMKPNEHLFGNGWWGNRMSFPPPPIDQVIFNMISVHISGVMMYNIVNNHLPYLKDYNEKVGAIGAMDYETMDFLQENGIKSYHSSAFTAMTDMGYDKTFDRRGMGSKILLVDVDPEKLPHSVRKSSEFKKNYKFLSAHFQGGDVIGSSKGERFQHAYNLLTQYSQDAKVVITARLHSAMAAMAQNIPVIFIQNVFGNDNDKVQQEGMLNLVHQWDPTNKELPWDFDLDNMPPNPGVHLIDRYRASFLNYMKKRSSIYMDTANLYGMLPLERLGKNVPTSPDPVHDRFHFIFTTAPETITWRVVRAVETVFFHHPDATVIIHSNTLPLQGSKFDIFAEAGYDCIVEPYNFEELMRSYTKMLGAKTVDQFMSVLPERRKEQYWYSHETDLLRMMIMLSEGGVYLDTDQYLVQPIPKSMKNVLGWQDIEFDMLNGAVMIFEKNNEFLRECFSTAIELAAFKYNKDDWGIFGPNLLTATYRNKHHKHDDIASHITVLDHEAFYPYIFYEARHCFEKDATEFNPITSDTFTVHLNTKMTQQYVSTIPGTVCDELFRIYCIFCDEVFTTPE